MNNRFINNTYIFHSALASSTEHLLSCILYRTLAIVHPQSNIYAEHGTKVKIIVETCKLFMIFREKAIQVTQFAI